jgi:hypothetical protein
LGESDESEHHEAREKPVVGVKIFDEIDAVVLEAGRRLPHRREWPSLKCVKIGRADFARVPIEP